MHVEDELDLRDVVAMALQSFGGFTVESCESGSQALEKVDAFKPDIILLDVMMPIMDGTATLKALKANPATAHIPIIFMTAKLLPADHARYIALGAVGVIGKPFRVEQLCQRVQELWTHANAAAPEPAKHD